MLYFQFLQTVAAFVVSAIKIDRNKDGIISRSEITTFVTGVVFPLLFNASSLAAQWQAFYDKMKSLDVDGFKSALMDIVSGQLLPTELTAAEEAVDKIALAVFNLIDAIQKTIKAVSEVFGKKEIEIRLIEKK